MKLNKNTYVFSSVQLLEIAVVFLYNYRHSYLHKEQVSLWGGGYIVTPPLWSAGIRKMWDLVGSPAIMRFYH